MLCSPQPKILDLTPAKYYLRGVIGRYPHARTIHLVMDNSHTRKALVDRFDETEGGRLWNRPTVHYTPKHGSWLKQAEIAINLFSPSALGGGASQIKPVAAAKPAPGIVASIATTSPFSGILLAVSLAKGRLLNFTVTVLVTGIQQSATQQSQMSRKRDGTLKETAALCGYQDMEAIYICM